MHAGAQHDIVSKVHTHLFIVDLQVGVVLVDVQQIEGGFVEDKPPNGCIIIRRYRTRNVGKGLRGRAAAPVRKRKGGGAQNWGSNFDTA